MTTSDQRPSPFHILFVCAGNICRSPLAEGFFRHHARAAGAADAFVIDSAGTDAWFAGDPPDPRVTAAAARRGVRLEGRARRVVADDLTRFDLIVCADSDNRADLLAVGADPHRTRLLLVYDAAATARDVPDPYGGDIEGFEDVCAMIDRACRALLDAVRVSP